MRFPLGHRRLALAAAGTLIAASLAVAPAGTAHAAVGCSVTYQRSWDNGSGFGADITITNTGDPLDGWVLTYTWPDNQRVDYGWAATWSQPPGSAVVTAASLPWNGSLPTGGTVSTGFNGTHSGANTDPTAFSVNGVVCGGQQPPAVLISPSLLVPEGGSATTGARLALPPTGNVTVGIVPGPGDPDLTLCSPASLLFTPTNWNLIQIVRVCAAEDADLANGSRIFTIGTGASFTATEIDNDLPSSTKVDNPFAGADGYVNPDRRSLIDAEADRHPAELAARMRAVGQQPTALWLDRIGAITAGRGLAGHLDAAVAQDAANGDSPVVVTVVLYNLPNRNCGSLAPGGELQVAANGSARYRTEYIDPIRAVLARPQYASLRVALIVEPDSLPNLVTHVLPREYATVSCLEVTQSNAYRDGIRYAVSHLATLPNTYLYLDFSNSAWLGWTDNLNPTLALYDLVLAAAAGGPGYNTIHGFATNTANYVPVEEIFLPDPFGTVVGQVIYSARFFEWNPRFDERDYAADVRAWFAARGCADCGVLIDTSRNGWGGSARPVTGTPSNDLNTYVNQNRIDRRPIRVGWCNQRDAGLGNRPTGGTGIPGVDAFVWVKPPGESDGISVDGVADPDDPFKRFTPECQPDLRNRYDSSFPTNALPDAPHFGRWFPQHFLELVQNAYPAIGG